MIRRPPRSTLSSSSAASDVYKRQHQDSGAGGLSPQLFDSRAGEPLWEEHYHEQNYPGDGAADGGGLAMKRKLCLEQQQKGKKFRKQQQKGKKSRFANGDAPPIPPPRHQRQDGITLAIGTRTPTCSARPYVAQDAQIPVNPLLKLSGRGIIGYSIHPMPKIVETKRSCQRLWQYQYWCPHGCKLNIEMCNRDDQTVELEFLYREGDPHTVNLQGTKAADRACPACGRHIQFQLVHEHNAPVSYTHLTLPTKRIV